MSTRAVFVLGMHRSGTSAVAGLVSLLGVPPIADDLLPADEANPKGYWESSALKDANDALLEELGWNWAWPPRVAPRWDDASVERARREFPPRGGEWAWKDPRACVTFGFWTRVWDVEPTVVLVYRDPREVAASLARRDGMERRCALALWERYVRLSLAAAMGRPTLVLSYSNLLNDPLEWTGRLCAFLAERGFSVGEPPAEGLHSFLDRSLRRARTNGGHLAADADLSPAQIDLFRVLESLRGKHDSFVAPELGDETEWVENALARPQIEEARRHAAAVERSLGEVLASKSFRYTAPVRRLVGLLTR